MGIVPAGGVLFSDTIDEKIAFGLTDAEERRDREAAAAVGAEQFTPELPHGYGTRSASAARSCPPASAS